jgi:hypothetical protein
MAAAVSLEQEFSSREVVGGLWHVAGKEIVPAQGKDGGVLLQLIVTRRSLTGPEQRRRVTVSPRTWDSTLPGGWITLP